MIVWCVLAVPVLFMLTRDLMAGFVWFASVEAGTYLDGVFVGGLFVLFVIACAAMLAVVDVMLGPKEVLQLDYHYAAKRDRGLP